MAVRLSALCAGRSLLPTPRMIPGTLFYCRLSKLHGHNAAGKIRQIEKEKSNNLIGIRTSDLPTYANAVFDSCFVSDLFE
jgi:hypothetical protein